MRRSEGLPNASQPARHKGRTASPALAASRICLSALALMLSAPVLAARLSCTQPASAESRSGLEELDEVVVSGERVTTNTKDVLAWLALLPGRYTYEGFVDLCGQGIATDQLPVSGSADCSRSGSMPNVFCAVNVRWPETKEEDGQPLLGGVSHLNPALLAFSLEKRHRQAPGMSVAEFSAAMRNGVSISPPQTGYWGLMFTLVDNRGLAEWGSGTLVGDTLTSRESCVGIPGACRKITRITARPGSDEILMAVDIRFGSRSVLRESFVLRREPAARKGESAGGPSP